ATLLERDYEIAEDLTACEVVDVEKIRAIIPHRYPFLLVDRAFSKPVQEGENEEIVGIKNITNSDPCIRTPSGEVMRSLPNWFLLEIAAQIGCVQPLAAEENKNKLGIYMGIDDAVFSAPVLPGDQLFIRVRNLLRRGPFGKSEAVITVNGNEVIKMSLRFAIMDPKQ
ncbi:MAG: hypothetical protein D6820_16670, partial [Lentisphaerae bacterium]